MTTVQRDESWRGYFQSVNVNGVPVVEPVSLTSDASDGMGGPLVWTGALFGTAWEDRRERSYDIYFNRLDIEGKKLGPDVRVTDTKGFTVGPSLLWDGSTWILAYSEESESGIFRIFARRLNYDGSNTGEAIPLTDRFLDARGARLLRTQSGLSLFYTAARRGFQYLRLGVELAPLAAPVVLPLENAGEVAVRWNRDRFFVAWSVKTKTFGSDIWAMSIDEQGRTIAAPRRLVSGSSTARSPAWVTYGDRAYLIWADDYDLEGTVELSGQMFDRDFLPLSERQRLTWLFAATFDPTATIGGSSIGILFRSRALGSWQSFFLSLQCVEGLK
jgi:hypothetical protein